MHTRTDPICQFFRPPRTLWQTSRYNRNRGRSCRPCMMKRGQPDE